MNKTTWVAWAIKNCIVLICFAALAIYFGHWWIVLFAALFMSSIESKNITRRICDGCGRTIYSTDLNDVDNAARRAGWIRKKNGDKWEDFCPECQIRGIENENRG